MGPDRLSASPLARLTAPCMPALLEWCAKLPTGTRCA